MAIRMKSLSTINDCNSLIADCVCVVDCLCIFGSVDKLYYIGVSFIYLQDICNFDTNKLSNYTNQFIIYPLIDSLAI